MSLPEALKGLSHELEESRGPLEWLGHILKFMRLVVTEIVIGTLKQAPYGLRAMRTYRWACTPDSGSDLRAKRPTLHKDVRYSDDAERCVLDLYVPPTDQGSEARPVVLFCHGGVWASGSKWHYAPMATRLAQEGAVVGVIHYTLYPEAMAPEMVAEVGSALTWTMDNIERFGGCPDKVSLVGHSAGAHLCSMVLLKRASSAPAPQQQGVEDVTAPDTRMPMQFIGMAGVYDISSHYEYEDARGVAKVSTMARAMGGHGGFPGLSPSNILARASFSESMDEDLVAGDEEGFTRLKGEQLSRRLGLDHDPGLPLPRISALDGSHQQQILEFLPEDATKLPPMLLLSGMKDITVPWYESAEFALRLRDLGVATKKLTYKTADHGTFVTGWKAPLKDGVQCAPRDCKDLPDACRDVIKLVLQGPQRVAFPSTSPATPMMTGDGLFAKTPASRRNNLKYFADALPSRSLSNTSSPGQGFYRNGPARRGFSGSHLPKTITIGSAPIQAPRALPRVIQSVVGARPVASLTRSRVAGKASLSGAAARVLMII